MGQADHQEALPQDPLVAPRSRYLRQLFEIYPSGRRWPSPSWVLEENLFRNLQTTIQDLPSQRAATTKTKELPEKEKKQCILPSHTLSIQRIRVTLCICSPTPPVWTVEACICVRCISFGFGVCPLY